MEDEVEQISKNSYKGSDFEEQEHDRYKNNPDLLAQVKPKATRLFSYNWASGFISPFRPTPQGILSDMLQHVHFSTPNRDSLLDLGCGDGIVLVQALQTFPSTQLKRAIGIDLDKPLLEAAKDRIFLQAQTKTDPKSKTEMHDILSRLELYHGDLTTKDDLLSPVMPTEPNSKAPQTMKRLIEQCSHLFVYLLPDALSKLTPLLLEAIELQHKVVLSMRWEIPELKHYLIQGGV
ncbi:hypothetical protein BX616_000762 [Lobosporangium transversale]|nr:hypothetical protein BX616_000762 [Lobosporangium transversale]